jgi:1-acyl-sn-glycerol-3-phosphate acyltransferase
MLGWAAGVRFRITGTIPDASCILVMNHQSVLDPIIALSEIRERLPLALTRARYKYGVPGISPWMRAARFPFLRQTRASSAEDFEAITQAVRRTAAEETSLLIFPEGRRTLDGEIARFMTRGLEYAIENAHGLWQSRTVWEVLSGIAGTTVSVSVIGPFSAPPGVSSTAFIGSLRAQMIATLRQLRDG